MVGIGVEPHRFAEDELDVASERSGEPAAIDDRHRVDLQLDRHDRDRGLDGDQPGPGLAGLKRTADRELALGIDQAVVPLLEAGAEQLEALPDATLALQ